MNGRFHYCAQRPCLYCTLLGRAHKIWEMFFQIFHLFRYCWCIHFECSSELCMWVSEMLILYEPKQTWDCDEACPLETESKREEEKKQKTAIYFIHLIRWNYLGIYFFLYTLWCLSVSGVLCCNCVAEWNESRFRGLIKSDTEETVNMTHTQDDLQKAATVKVKGV